MKKPAMNLEIEKVLVISTGHATEKDMNLISDTEGPYPYTTLPSEYGTTIRLQTDMVINEDGEWEGHFSKAFLKIIKLALDNDCLWINFDRDGSIYEDLETFDW